MINSNIYKKIKNKQENFTLNLINHAKLEYPYKIVI